MINTILPSKGIFSRVENYHDNDNFSKLETGHKDWEYFTISTPANAHWVPDDTVPGTSKLVLMVKYANAYNAAAH
jgi:hypothetical protein